MAKKKLPEKKVRKNIIYLPWLVGFVFLLWLVALVVWLFLPDKSTVIKKSVDSFITEVKNNNKEKIVEQGNEKYDNWLQIDKEYAGVMIDNHFDAWDHQFGLSLSPLVYNVPVEGGVTRFLALFPLDIDVKQIGPIRSVRPYFLDLFPEHALLLVHVGGSPAALAKIKQKNLPDLNEMTAAGMFFYRDKNFTAPHNTFISGDNLNSAIDYFGYKRIGNSNSYNFNVSPQISTSSQSVFIDYSARSTYDVEYRFNVDFSAYERFRAGEQQFDALTNKPLLVDNIIIEKVPSEIVLDNKLRIALDVLGKGKAIFFINGNEIDGTWEKLSPSGPSYYYSSDGKEINFKRGNIWIEIVPDGHKVTVK